MAPTRRGRTPARQITKTKRSPIELRVDGRAVVRPATRTAATRQARYLAAAGLTVELELEGERRLYRPEWAAHDIPYRVACPSCGALAAYPRGRTAAPVCRACYERDDPNP